MKTLCMWGEQVLISSLLPKEAQFYEHYYPTASSGLQIWLDESRSKIWYSPTALGNFVPLWGAFPNSNYGHH